MGSATPLSSEKLAARTAANLRTVQRSDPSIVEILETSTHTVIYNWDETEERWEKQKQEGPMFIVRRDKAPEYALYLLNRNAVKNTLVALVPGEMKATRSDEQALQLARRGERLRRSFWFHEGSRAADAFREGILRICGEPSKPAQANGLSSSTTAAGPSRSPAVNGAPPAGADGLSRLFAGLMPAASPSATPPPITNPTSPTMRTITPTPQPQLQVSAAPAAAAPMTLAQAVAGARPANHTSPPPAAFPGQTVDDLLNSVLGVSAGLMAGRLPVDPLPAPAPVISPPPVTVPPVSQARAPPPPADQVSPPPQEPLTASSLLSSMMGNLPPLNKQLGGPPLNGTPLSSPPSRNLPPTLPPLSSLPVNGRINGLDVDPTGPSAPAMSPPPVAATSQQPSTLQRDLPPHMSSPVPPAPQAPRAALQADMVKGALARSPPPLESQPEKASFINQVLHLIYNDPTFADELWAAHQARAGS